MATLDVLPLKLLPLGFRFRPTDQELLNHYLKPKIKCSINANCAIIPEVDVCKCEPWDLPEKSPIKSEDSHWFFFAPKDRKYPNGRRSNRATEAGYWKSTGRDRAIKTCAQSPMAIGMKKTLVFHRGRAPTGKRTGWTMHEYRTVEPEFNSGHFVLCRLIKKPETEEKSLPSNANEMDSSRFLPTLNNSSPDDTSHGDDALDEFTTPLHQVNLPTNLDERIEETHIHSDINADIGAIGIDMDNKKEDPLASVLHNLNHGCEQICSEEFDCNYSFDNCTSHLYLDDSGVGVPSMDENSGFLTKLLDFIPDSTEEESPPELDKSLENGTGVLPTSQVYHSEHESPLDNTSGIHNVIVDTAGIEALPPQEDPVFLASCQWHGPLCPSNYFLSPTHNFNNEFGAQLDFGMETVDFQNSESSDASNSLFSVENSAGISINIRELMPQDLPNPNQVGHQGMGAGNAFRRIRLQTSTVFSDGESSSDNEGHDEKTEMSEPGKNVDFEPLTSKWDTEIAYFCSSDNDDTSPSWNAEDAASPTELDDLCIKPEDPPLHEAPKAASFYFGRVNVVIPVILCVLGIGIGLFFSSR